MTLPADILDAAADLIETDGWIQGKGEYRGRRCLINAIGEAARRIVGDIDAYPMSLRIDLMNSTYAAVHDELGLTAQPKFRALGAEVYAAPDLVAWNDHDGRRAYDVIETLRQSAKNLRNQGAT